MIELALINNLMEKLEKQGFYGKLQNIFEDGNVITAKLEMTLKKENIEKIVKLLDK